MNDTLIFLVLAGLALVFKWLTSQAAGEAKKPEPPLTNEPAPRRPPNESEEERVRRFLEALGAPPGTPPPPPVRPRQIVTPKARAAKPKVKRSWVQPLPPLVTTPEDMPLPPLTTTPRPEPVVAREVQPAPEILVPRLLPRQPAPRRRAPVTSLGSILRSREGIRQAIILREVLGPPRGLQALDDLRPI